MLSQPKDILVLSLAIGDFAMSLLVVPLGLSSAVSKKWTTGHEGCMWYGFISSWIGLSSMLQLTTIAVERYRTLSQPTPYNISTKLTVQAIAASWISAFVASCFPLIGWSTYAFEGYGLHCSIPWDSSTKNNASYNLFLLLIFFAIPVTTIVLSYVKIYIVVRNLRLNARKIWGDKSPATRVSYEAQVKISKQILIIIAGFLVSWTPYAVVSMLSSFGGFEIPLVYHEIPSLFAKFSIIQNPIIYCFAYKKLRKKVVETLRNVVRFTREESSIQPKLSWKWLYQSCINITTKFCEK